ncbi:AsmA family protein [Deltaproteobacteria bacterium IMCC39524]|nr:AsmA family protein [Deltaproteobacteria bacterium IMCC39524]
MDTRIVMRQGNSAYTKSIKIALKVFAALATILVIILVAGAVYLSSNLDHFIQSLTTKVEENTGRAFVVNEAALELSLNPEIELKDVSLSNAEWGSHKQMVMAESLVVKLNLLALFFGEILFDQIRFVAPVFHLETNAQGRGNWDFLDVRLPIMSVNHIEVNKGQLSYQDGMNGRKTDLNIDHLNLQKLLESDLQEVEIKAKYLDNSVKINGKTGSLKNWFKNVPFILDININSADAQASVKGEINQPIDFKGLNININIEADTLSSFSWVTDINFPPVGPVALGARLSDQKNGYKLDDFSVDIGDSNVSGPVEIITTKTQPMVSAKLTASGFDTADFKDNVNGDMKQNSEEGSQDQAKQDDPLPTVSSKALPLGALKHLDADISLSAKNSTLFAIPVHNLNLKLLLENGLLKIRPITAEVANGSIRADLVINASSQTAKVTANFLADQVELGELLKALSGKAHLDGGKTDVEIAINGQGSTMKELVSTLSGQVSSVTGKGQINYDLSLAGENLIFNIFKKMNPLKEKQETTNLDCMVARFDIEDGIATIDKGLAYESESLKILGNGTIDLNSEKINILLSSKSTVASFLQVKGSLGKPEVKVNPVTALQKGTSLWAAIMTGGISMAAEIVFDYVTSDGSPCEIAQREINPIE